VVAPGAVELDVRRGMARWPFFAKPYEELAEAQMNGKFKVSKVWVSAAAALLLPLTVSAAAGPGFDCRKASGDDEAEVCHSKALSRLDRQMTQLYRTVQACSLMGGRGANRDDQTAWLAERKLCSADDKCLIAAYHRRISQLKPMAARAKAERKAGHCPDQ